MYVSFMLVFLNASKIAKCSTHYFFQTKNDNRCQFDLDLHSRSLLYKYEKKRKKTSKLIVLQIFCIDMGEIQYAVMAYWAVEAHAKFISQDQYLRERTLLRWFINRRKQFNTSLH